MEDDEPVLPHEPDLMLAILRAAHQAPASLDDAMARRRANLAAAHEPLPEPEDDLRRRLERVAMILGAPTRSHLPASIGPTLPLVVPGCWQGVRTVSTSRCCARSPSFAPS